MEFAKIYKKGVIKIDILFFLIKFITFKRVKNK